jgi:hypothetical protein
MLLFLQATLLATVAFLSQPSLSTRSISAEVRKLQRDFYTINEHFEKKLGKDTADVESILTEANKWMSSLKQSDDNSSPLISSLELFLSLRELSQSELTCNSRGYKIITKNNQALANLARYGLRPVDKVAIKYMRQHARECCSHYPDLYRQKIQEVGKDAMEKVEDFAQFIAKFALTQGQFQLTFGAKQLVDVVSRNPLVYILLLDDQSDSSGAAKRNRAGEIEALAQYLGDRSPNQDELPKERQLLEELTQKYLVEPCKRYTEQVGPEVYQPLEADLNISLDSRGEVSQCDSDWVGFKLGMAYHKLCNMYVLNESSDRLIDSLAQLD